jgi:hypothetical protein
LFIIQRNLLPRGQSRKRPPNGFRRLAHRNLPPKGRDDRGEAGVIKQALKLRLSARTSPSFIDRDQPVSIAAGVTSQASQKQKTA